MRQKLDQSASSCYFFLFLFLRQFLTTFIVEKESFSGRKKKSKFMEFCFSLLFLYNAYPTYSMYHTLYVRDGSMAALLFVWYIEWFWPFSYIVGCSVDKASSFKSPEISKFPQETSDHETPTSSGQDSDRETVVYITLIGIRRKFCHSLTG